MNTKEQLFEWVYSLGDKCFYCECEYGKDDARAKKARAAYDSALDMLCDLGLHEEYCGFFFKRRLPPCFVVNGLKRAYKRH